MEFIDLEKTYDRISEEIIWHLLEKEHIHKRYMMR